MSKSIELSQAQWAVIYTKLSKDYPPSVLLIREKMRSVLGFTTRSHRGWVSEGLVNGHDFGRYVNTVHLDFYNEPKRTMFMLKYSEYLDNSGKNALD